jgi:hypothetical protein
LRELILVQSRQCEDAKRYQAGHNKEDDIVAAHGGEDVVTVTHKLAISS